MSTAMSMTFTKLFSSITESTIWCEDHPTVRLWICMLAMADRNGRVFGTIPGLANRARVTVDECRASIHKFLNPDPDSRSNTYDPSSEGRRIVQIEGGWRLINHAHYRDIRDEEERRAYKAEHERKRRAAKRGQRGQKWTGVDSGGHNAEADTEADSDLQKQIQSQKQGKSNPFVPPALEEVIAHCASRKSPIDPEEFHSWYQSNGWKTGKNSMKDWKAAVITWEKNAQRRKPDGRNKAQQRQDSNLAVMQQVLRDLDR